MVIHHIQNRCRQGAEFSILFKLSKNAFIQVQNRLDQEAILGKAFQSKFCQLWLATNKGRAQRKQACFQASRFGGRAIVVATW